MKIGVPKETAEGERRVALVPEVVKKLSGQGHELLVQSGAGDGALIPDSAFEEAGATLVDDAATALGADVVVKVAAPNPEETAQLGADSVLIAFLGPLTNGEGVKAIAADRGHQLRAGSRPPDQPGAVHGRPVLAGEHLRLPRGADRGAGAGALLPDADDRRGDDSPRHGAGAGCRGRRACRRSPPRAGSVRCVQGFDVRAAVKEQVESLGAHFLEFDLGGDLEGAGGYAKELTPEQQARQQELMAEAIGKVDVVITTALVPGRRAPILVTEDAVKKMKPGW